MICYGVGMDVIELVKHLQVGVVNNRYGMYNKSN